MKILPPESTTQKLFYLPLMTRSQASQGELYKLPLKIKKYLRMKRASTSRGENGVVTSIIKFLIN
jgi:hypothetical protein